MDDHYQQEFSEPWEVQPDDPRVNDLKPDLDYLKKKLLYDFCKAIGVVWMVEKLPFLEKKQWVKDIERPF